MTINNQQKKATAWVSDIQSEYEILEEYGEYEKVTEKLMELPGAIDIPRAKKLVDSLEEFRKMLAEQRQARIAVITKLRIMNHEARRTVQESQMATRRRTRLKKFCGLVGPRV